MYDPAVVVGSHEGSIGFQHFQRDASHLSRGQPRIHAADFQRLVQTSDMVFQAKRLMSKGACRLCQAVTEHDGAVENGNHGLVFGNHFSRQVHLSLLF